MTIRLSNVDRIRRDASLADVVAQNGVKLKKDGVEFKALCPFHSEKTPSFTIFAEKSGVQKFHCFGCGAHGDVIDFVERIKGVDTGEAIRILGREISRPNVTPRVIERKDPYAGIVPIEPPADATIKPGERVRVYNPKRGKWGSFTPSLVHPYRRADGSLIGFVLRRDYVEDGKPTKETPSVMRVRLPDGSEAWSRIKFARPLPLYGLDRIKNEKQIIVVEGEKCADALFRVTRRAAVAWPSGGKNARHVDWSPLAGLDVILWPDADEAGIATMNEVGAILAGQGCRVRLVGMPDSAPTSWDVADMIADGAGRKDVEAHIRHSLSDFVGPDEPIGEPELDKSVGEPQTDEFKQNAGSDGVKLDDFRAYMPAHNYIFMPAGEFWPAASVNARIEPIPVLDRHGLPVLDKNGKAKFLTPTAWLDQNRPVEQMTWAPGEPNIISDRLISDGGWIERPGCACFNLYRPPSIKPGDASKARPWLEHVRGVYPDDADHIIRWLAHRVQRPHEKINHALVLGGSQGIGKDTLLEPVKAAIGPWNFAEVSPQNMLGRFNGFVKSVILRVSEARDLGDVDRFGFYDHMKTYTAAPPDVLRVDEKHVREYNVFNVCGVIITTNHKTDGIYLPADDRRHYVAWSDLDKSNFNDDYWARLYGFYARGGDRDVAAYLATLDLSDFNAKAPPAKTAAFWAIADANLAPEDAELADVLDELGNPPAITLLRISAQAKGSFRDWIGDIKNRRKIPHRLEKAGYVSVRNSDAKDRLWKISGKRQAIYARKSLSLRDQISAARDLT